MIEKASSHSCLQASTASGVNMAAYLERMQGDLNYAPNGLMSPDLSFDIETRAYQDLQEQHMALSPISTPPHTPQCYPSEHL